MSANSFCGMSSKWWNTFTCSGSVRSKQAVPLSFTSSSSAVGFRFTNRPMQRFICAGVASVFHPFSLPSMSNAHSPVLSLWVVTAACPPVMAAMCLANSLAPPTCPDNTGIAKRPVLSMHTTAGSVYLFFKQAAMLRTQIPIAPIKTMLSNSLKCSRMNPLYEEISVHPSVSIPLA